MQSATTRRNSCDRSALEAGRRRWTLLRADDLLAARPSGDRLEADPTRGMPANREVSFHLCWLAEYPVTVDFVRPIEAIVPGAQGRVLAVLAETTAELNLRTIAQLAGVSQAQASRLPRAGWPRGRRAARGTAGVVVPARASARGIPCPPRPRPLHRPRARRDRSPGSLSPHPPVSVIVFGSFARREAEQDSDIDVVVVRPADVDEDDDDWAADRRLAQRRPTADGQPRRRARGERRRRGGTDRGPQPVVGGDPSRRSGRPRPRSRRPPERSLGGRPAQGRSRCLPPGPLLRGQGSRSSPRPPPATWRRAETSPRTSLAPRRHQLRRRRVRRPARRAAGEDRPGARPPSPGRPDGAEVERDLRRLLLLKTKAEYDPDDIAPTVAAKAVERGQRCAAVA